MLYAGTVFALGLVDFIMSAKQLRCTCQRISARDVVPVTCGMTALECANSVFFGKHHSNGQQNAVVKAEMVAPFMEAIPLSATHICSLS